MSSATPATCAGSTPKLSRVTMYAPPALGYALIVWRYENTRITSSATIPSDSGTSVPNASEPAPPISRTVSISSVA